MRRTMQLLAIAITLTTATFALAQSQAEKSFAELKSLAGEWQGTSDHGPVTVTFRETGSGSALLSEIQGHADMISMIHMDGPDRLMLTHYCSTGNQPRMVATASPDGKTITFDFLDATNLASPDAGHMNRVIISMLDPNHHTEEWIFVDHDKARKAFFDLTRKQSL